MSRIKEIIIEPSRIEVGSSFKIKVKVQDDFFNKQSIITESGLIIVTENNEIIRTEWGQ